jgi:hypothetical protein
VPFEDEIDRLIQYIFVLAVAIAEKSHEKKLLGTRLRLGIVGQKYFEYLIVELFGNEDAHGHKFNESSSHY